MDLFVFVISSVKKGKTNADANANKFKYKYYTMLPCPKTGSNIIALNCEFSV